MLTTKTRLIGCGIFKAEFDLIDPSLRSAFDPVFLNSMLHMKPRVLDEQLAALLPPERSRVVLLYGDCSPHMREFAARPGCARTRGINCCEICMGSERYRELRRTGAFFLLPEWTVRWKTVFIEGMGFKDVDLVRSFMKESHSGLLYLDTGAHRPDASVLAAAAEYLGLPLRIETVGVTHLEAALHAALAEIDHDR